METKTRFKLILLLTVLATFAQGSLLAQRIPTTRFGVKAGMNVSNLYLENVHDENARIGFSGGLYGQVLSSRSFALQPELLYSTRGTKANYQGVIVDQEVRFNLNYLDVPLLAIFKLGPSAEIHAGGYTSYLMSANIEYHGNVSNGVDELDRDHFKSFDYGLVGGFGLNFGAAQVGARYNLGLVKLADSNEAREQLGDSKNSAATIYLALNLNQY